MRPKNLRLIFLFLLLLTWGVSGFAQYCNVTDYVDGRVRIANIYWPSRTVSPTIGGYVNYTATDSLTVYPTFSYPITVEFPSNASLAGNVVSFWVDWNQDFLFTDSSERVNLVSRNFGATFNGKITVPANAVAGPTRIRIVGFYGLAARVMNPCASTDPNNDGSVIDLIIDVKSIPTALPNCPVIEFPNDAVTEVLNPVKFSWRKGTFIEGITGYKLYLDTSNAFTALPISLTDTTFSNPTTLAGGETYFWKIVAVNGRGESAGCIARSFTMSALTPNCPIITSPRWGGPKLKRTVNFAWSAAGDSPERYRLLVDTIYPPRKILVDSLTTTSYTATALAPNKWFYYTILAGNVNGWSVCKADSFLTGDSTGYCTKVFGGGSYRLTSVSLGNYSDTGVPASGYFDKRPSIVKLQVGKTDTLRASVNVVYGVTQVHAYIDWNHNGVLTDTGEIYRTVRTGANHQIEVLPPADAIAGRTLMRIVLTYIVPPRTMSPCGTHGYDGNAIDYWVDLNFGDTCRLRPVAGIAHLDSVNCTTGVNTISVSGAYQGPCLKARWQQWNGSAWTSTSDSLPSLKVTAVTMPMAYRYFINCRDSVQWADSTKTIVVYPAMLPMPQIRDTLRCAPGTFNLDLGMLPPGIRPIWFKEATGLNADSLGGEAFHLTKVTTPNLVGEDSLVRYVAYESPFGCVSPRQRVVAKTFGIPATPALAYPDTLSGCVGSSFTLNGTAGFARYRWSTGDSTANIIVNTQKVVTLTVENKFGCASAISNTVVVQLLDKPNRPALVPIGGDTLEAQVSPVSNAYQYVWLFNGQVVPNITGSKFPTTQSGNYRVFVKNVKNTAFCVGDTSPQINYITALGDNISQVSFDLVPNPAQDQFNIVSSFNIAHNVYVRDALGRVVISDKTTADMISVRDLTPGIYYVQVMGAGSKKLVVQ